MKKLLKRELGTILGALALGAILVGIIALVGAMVEWFCADGGRYMLGLGIMGYVLYRCFKAEFGE